MDTEVWGHKNFLMSLIKYPGFEEGLDGMCNVLVRIECVITKFPVDSDQGQQEIAMLLLSYSQLTTNGLPAPTSHLVKY